MPQILTRKDYDFYECSSAFQKCVRRGLERESLYFGIELFSSGYSKYLWKRMLCVASEDIGLANPQIGQQINALYNNYKTIIELGDTHGSEVVVIHAIMLLVRSPKSRICDHAKVYAMVTDDNFDIPDFALDNHTRKGKILGRSFDYFIEEGAKLENKVEMTDPYEDKFNSYLMDLQNKKIKEDGFYGYDKRNVHHKSIRHMAEWKAKNNQQNLF